MDEKIKIKVIIGSTREGRFGDKPAHWIYEEIKKSENIDVEILDLRDYQMPFFNDPVSPSYAGGKYSNEIVQRWAGKINEADGFIVVTPEYNHGYPAILKNAFDSIFPEWAKKPIGFVSYGGVGGARCVEQLRLVAIELQMVPMKSAIHIQQPWNLVDGKGNLKDGAFDFLKDNAQKFIDQLLWWGIVLKKPEKEINN